MKIIAIIFVRLGATLITLGYWIDKATAEEIINKAAKEVGLDIS